MSTTKKCEILVWIWGMGPEQACGRKATHYSSHPSVGYCCAQHAATIPTARPIPQKTASRKES